MWESYLQGCWGARFSVVARIKISLHFRRGWVSPPYKRAFGGAYLDSIPKGRTLSAWDPADNGSCLYFAILTIQGVENVKCHVIYSSFSATEFHNFSKQMCFYSITDILFIKNVFIS